MGLWVINLNERPLHLSLKWALIPQFTVPMTLLTALQDAALLTSHLSMLGGWNPRRANLFSGAEKS